MEAEKRNTESLLKEVRKGGKGRAAPGTADKDQPVLRLLAERADLIGLPVRNAAECQVSAQEAAAIRKLSVELCTSGKGFVLSQEPSISTRVKEQRFAAIAGVLETKGPHWRDDVRTRGLVQILQTEPESVRVKLAKTLSETKTKSAATALAQRAVFDLSLDVRDAAV